MDKHKYIEERVNIDYIIKSKNSSLAFGLCAVVLLIMQLSSNIKYIYFALVFVIIILSAIRILNVKRFSERKISLEVATRNVTITILINATLWSVLSFISLSTDDTVRTLITYTLLLAFIAGSIVTVSSKRAVLITFNLLMLAPIIYFAIRLASSQQSNDAYFLIAFCIVNFIYTLKQSSTICNELKRRIGGEYDLKKSLDELALSKKNLEEESIKTFHASRLSSLGEMASGVAHEINNPLTIIQGMSNTLLLKNNEKLDEATLNKLAKIHSASERIAKIVRSMKLVSRRDDKLENEVTSVEKILEISIGLFEERIKTEKVQFTIENETNPQVFCNPLQISQILINLMSNALDALSNDKAEEKTLCLNIKDDGPWVKIRVVNSGQLLSEEVVKRMFEPFFSTKSLGKGTGLGLSISQTLANTNGGNLYYEPYQGKISFVLKLKKHQ